MVIFHGELLNNQMVHTNNMQIMLYLFNLHTNNVEDHIWYLIHDVCILLSTYKYVCVYIYIFTHMCNMLLFDGNSSIYGHDRSRMKQQKMMEIETAKMGPSYQNLLSWTPRHEWFQIQQLSSGTSKCWKKHIWKLG